MKINKIVKHLKKLQEKTKDENLVERIEQAILYLTVEEA